MKCEKHNTDMVWQGDLRTGSMHCDGCDADATFGCATCTPQFGMDTAVGESYTIQKEKFADMYQQTPQPLPPVMPGAPAGSASGQVGGNIVDTLNLAKERVRAANGMMQRHGGHVSRECPYCLGSPGNTINRGLVCKDKFDVDKKFLSMHGVQP